MSKAKTLATTVSTGNVLADGTVVYAEVSAQEGFPNTIVWPTKPEQ